MERPELIEPGVIYAYDIDLWNTAQVFFKGHRIGLEIASSAFPKYDRNLNSGEDLASGTSLVIAEQSVYHDTVHALRPDFAGYTQLNRLHSDAHRRSGDFRRCCRDP